MEEQNLQAQSGQGNKSSTSERLNLLENLLGLCFDQLDTYGKDVSTLEGSVKLFSYTLAEYSFEAIEAAFLEHLKTSEGYPKPVNIVELIDGQKNTQKMCGIRYNSILKIIENGGWDAMSYDEVDFKKAYEAQQNSYAKQERGRDSIAQERIGQSGSGGFEKLAIATDFYDN